MSWGTPKTNWAAGNVPTAADFNRIEGNAQSLNCGGGGMPISPQSIASVAVGPDKGFDVNYATDTFIRSSGAAEYIKYINSEGSLPGRKVKIINEGSEISVEGLESAPSDVGNYKAIRSITERSFPKGHVISLIYSGTYWYID